LAVRPIPISPHKEELKRGVPRFEPGGVGGERGNAAVRECRAEGGCPGDGEWKKESITLTLLGVEVGMDGRMLMCTAKT